MIDPSSLALLKGKKALVTGIANDQSIAWGCAKAFHAFGADVAVTYLNEKAKPYEEPLAKEIKAPIFMPLDLQREGQLEAVFAAIEKRRGKLDLCLHSIAFAPKEDLQGRVVDCSKAGFLLAMEISCWSFIRMAKLAEPLMKGGGVLFTMTYYGSQMVVDHYNIMGPVMPHSSPRRVIWPQSSGRRASESTRFPRVLSRPAPPRASPPSISCCKGTIEGAEP